jgi:hypothetical protein
MHKKSVEEAESLNYKIKKLEKDLYEAENELCMQKAEQMDLQEKFSRSYIILRENLIRLNGENQEYKLRIKAKNDEFHKLQ